MAPPNSFSKTMGLTFNEISPELMPAILLLLPQQGLPRVSVVDRTLRSSAFPLIYRAVSLAQKDHDRLQLAIQVTIAESDENGDIDQ
jgi:hypothetical protein